jgi:hypothetical protein
MYRSSDFISHKLKMLSDIRRSLIPQMPGLLNPSHFRNLIFAIQGVAKAVRDTLPTTYDPGNPVFPSH